MADSLSKKNLKESDIDYIKILLNDKLKLSSAFTNCVDWKTVNDVEESVATQMANEGKMLPGFDYKDEDNYESGYMKWTKKATRSSEGRYDAGYYSGDFMMLVHDILFNRCQYQLLMDIEPIKTMLYQVVCEDLSYCKNKKKDEEVGLAIGVCEALIALKLNTGFPIVAVAVYLTKKGFLDRLCQCK
ncbi:hypothetical protein [Emticicia sp. TH156]|uniref:hypothetical protein n=1 Tax=Emticicia sp. TH156 TaxID=2067454 RepID=UPI000C7760AB|nr:hypothetical protein [Emticicia sp. TH156]PLK42094.1 hypothetical protein C0V77_22705 [Emticicia sp. TH156]